MYRTYKGDRIHGKAHALKGPFHSSLGTGLLLAAHKVKRGSMTSRQVLGSGAAAFAAQLQVGAERHLPPDQPGTGAPGCSQPCTAGPAGATTEKILSMSLCTLWSHPDYAGTVNETSSPATLDFEHQSMHALGQQCEGKSQQHGPGTWL